MVLQRFQLLFPFFLGLEEMLHITALIVYNPPKIILKVVPYLPEYETLITAVRHILSVRNSTLLEKYAIELSASILMEYDLTKQILDGPGLLLIARHPRDNLSVIIYMHIPIIGNLFYMGSSSIYRVIMFQGG